MIVSVGNVSVGSVDDVNSDNIKDFDLIVICGKRLYPYVNKFEIKYKCNSVFYFPLEDINNEDNS